MDPTNFDQVDNIEELPLSTAEAINNSLKTDSLTILHLNIRSLSSNFNELAILIKKFLVKPTVVVCTEAWTVINIHEYDLQGYTIYYTGPGSNQADSTVAYVLDSVPHSACIKKIGEVNSIEIEIATASHDKLLVTGVYRPHGCDQSKFIESLNSAISLTNNRDTHILLGDFNIDILTDSAATAEYLDQFYANGYISAINTVTRRNPRGGTCLDHIFVKSNIPQIRSYVVEADITDHYPTLLEINIKSVDKERPPRQTINYHLLNRLGSAINWSSVYTAEDANTAVLAFTTLVLDAMTSSRFTKKHKKFKARKDWITPVLIQLSNRKTAMYRSLKQDPNNETKSVKYKRMCRSLKVQIAITKNNYYKGILERTRGNTTKLWQFVNRNFNRAEKSKTIHKLQVGEQIIEDPYVICNTLNGFFSSIGQSLSGEIQKPANAQIHNYNLPETEWLMPTNEQEIAGLIKALDVRSCSGHDGINANILQRLVDSISGPLAYIFNLVFTSGIFPDEFKKAVVIPIHKGGSKSDVNNYRPISLLCTLAKVLETLIMKRLNAHLNRFNILSDNQYGFRSNVSTNHALKKLTDFVYEKLDSHEPAAVIFLDLKKAFDTVNHRILLNKIQSLGIRQTSHNLLESYLSKRKQCVRINGINSEYSEINFGVPQGSVLGPLLFNIYINDLLIYVNGTVSFADDTVLLSTANTWDELETNMNRQLKDIYMWLNANELSLNADKTVFIPFTVNNSQQPNLLNLHLHKEHCSLTANCQCPSINRVDSTKYLGVTVDKNLKWNLHINAISKKTRYILYIFHRLKSSLHGDQLMILYHGIFMSVATYGIVAWGGTYATHTKPIQNIQDRILKILSGKTYSKSTLLMSISQYYHHICININKEKLRNDYSEIMGRPSRNPQISLPRCSKNAGQQSNLYNAIKNFNIIPRKYEDCLIHCNVNTYKFFTKIFLFRPFP